MKETVEIDIPISKNDLSYELAARAYSGVSLFPEKRARAEQESYFEYMTELYKELKEEADTDDQHALLVIEFIQFKQEYLQRYGEILSAKGGIMSTMITGAAKFPTSRNQKRMGREQKLSEAFEVWKEKAIRSMRKIVFPELGPIISGEADALPRLKKKLEKLEALQNEMKAINKLVKKKDRKGLETMGLSEKITSLYLKPNRYGEFRAFEPFELQNNNAEIRRVKQRIEKEELIFKRVKKERFF